MKAHEKNTVLKKIPKMEKVKIIPKCLKCIKQTFFLKKVPLKDSLLAHIQI